MCIPAGERKLAAIDKVTIISLSYQFFNYLSSSDRLFKQLYLELESPFPPLRIASIMASNYEKPPVFARDRTSYLEG
jgi:hypothetical protein